MNDNLGSLLYRYIKEKYMKEKYMKEKQKILEKIMPVAVLRALTPEAERSVPQPLIVEGLVTIRNFPFRMP